MDDFKSNPKMQCFKEGGAVKYESRREHKEEMSSDINQDKKIVKKALSMHDTQQHESKTDLAKLNKGGRAKKAQGTVKKYKTGGTVENQYAVKKTAKDITDIANTKRQKPALLCGGKSVKKMADGGGLPMPAPAAVNPMQAKLAMLEKQRQMEKMARAKKYLGPAQQGELISQSPEAAGLTPPPPPPPPGGMGQNPAMPGGMKKGGKACK